MHSTAMTAVCPRIISADELSNFSRFYAGDLHITSAEEVVPEAMQTFEGLSRRFVAPVDYKPGDFHQIIQLKPRRDAETMYVAYQTKIHSDSLADTRIEKLIYLLELQNSSITGYGEIRFFPESEEPFFMNRPFVGFTMTDERLRGNRLGARRLAIMNGLSEMYFGLPLHSAEFHSDFPKKSEGPWRKQIELGNARYYDDLQEREGYRFCFNNNPKTWN